LLKVNPLAGMQELRKPPIRAVATDRPFFNPAGIVILLSYLRQQSSYNIPDTQTANIDNISNTKSKPKTRALSREDLNESEMQGCALTNKNVIHARHALLPMSYSCYG